MSKAEGLLRALTDEAPIDYASSYRECAYCHVNVSWDVDLEDPNNHKPDCPWREAKEYIQRKDA